MSPIGSGAMYALADMVLVVTSMGVIKQAGATIPPIQLVFFRAIVGLLFGRAAHLAIPVRGVQQPTDEGPCRSRALQHAVLELQLCGHCRPAPDPRDRDRLHATIRRFSGLPPCMLGERILRRHWISSVICFAACSSS